MVSACNKVNGNCMSEASEKIICTMRATNLREVSAKKRFVSECEKFLKKLFRARFQRCGVVLVCPPVTKILVAQRCVQLLCAAHAEHLSFGS